MPSLTSSRLLTREDILAVVELRTGSGKDSEALMMECIQTPQKAVLARAIEDPAAIREMQWNIEPAEPGFAKVTVTVRRRIGFHLLNPAHWLVLSPARCLASLRSWVAAEHPGPEALSDGENLFELWETEAGMVCWVRGKKYKLTRVEDGQA
jgi:hypothetical protein